MDPQMDKLTQADFLTIPTNEVAGLVRASGTRVCVFPFNGTRRWFLLEHRSTESTAYAEATVLGCVRLYKMLFDHGIESVVAPIFGKELLLRGEEYASAVGESMKMLAFHPGFVSLYEDCDIRVHFYGDYRQEFAGKRQDILDAFHQATSLTASHIKHKLFYGVFADDATQTIADLAIQHYSSQGGGIPTKQDLIEKYYGENIEGADIFIGFERPQIYDYPMLSTGAEDLYFTVAPSFYMTETLLRKILYDHIYLRNTQEPDYGLMPQQSINAMRDYYHQRRHDALGLGRVSGEIWYAE
jgi:tuberculosinol/isotuberculosinol synthase